MLRLAPSTRLAPLLPIVLASFYACTPAFKGEYSDADKKEIIDDRWNEFDAKSTSDTLVNSMLRKPWLNNFRSTHSGNTPVLIMKEIVNRTDEHLDTEALNEAIKNDLINSGGVVRFVADAAQRDKILAEINYQQESGMVSEKTAKKKGRQTGADFIVTGAISSQVHTQGGIKTVTYQTNMILTDLETAEVVWSENYKVKKQFERAKGGW